MNVDYEINNALGKITHVYEDGSRVEYNQTSAFSQANANWFSDAVSYQQLTASNEFGVLSCNDFYKRFAPLHTGLEVF